MLYASCSGSLLPTFCPTMGNKSSINQSINLSYYYYRRILLFRSSPALLFLLVLPLQLLVSLFSSLPVLVIPRSLFFLCLVYFLLFHSPLPLCSSLHFSIFLLYNLNSSYTSSSSFFYSLSLFIFCFFLTSLCTGALVTTVASHLHLAFFSFHRSIAVFNSAIGNTCHSSGVRALTLFSPMNDSVTIRDTESLCHCFLCEI